MTSFGLRATYTTCNGGSLLLFPDWRAMFSFEFYYRMPAIGLFSGRKFHQIQVNFNPILFFKKRGNLFDLFRSNENECVWRSNYRFQLGLLPGELSDPLFFYFWPGPMPDTTESLQVGPVAVGSKKNQLTRSTCIAWSRVGALAANPWRTFHKDGLQFRHPKYWPEFNFFFKNNIYGPLPSWPLYSFNLFMGIFSWVKRLDGTAPSDQKGFRSKEVDSAA